MAPEKCTHCGSETLEPGFIEDTGESSMGYARWIAGPLETGTFGRARRLGKQRWRITAYRCSLCHHVELFARDPA
jgi:hypothetical protein